MQKYFISKDDFNNYQITGDDVFHIKNVMRLSVDDKIIVSNNEREVLAAISQIEKNAVKFEIISEIENNNELPFKIDLFQGYPKGDKLDDIVKHSVELGVNNIYGVITKRSVFKLDQARKDNKIARFNKIAKEASEQSNRKKLSTFVDIVNLNKIDFSKYDVLILCYEEAAKNNELSNLKKQIKKILPNSFACVIIGPEGGFDESEVTYLQEKGFVSCGLGPRILRTETASMYILSTVSYEWELK